MKRENKILLISAFDILNSIAYGRSPSPHHASHGGSMICDSCGQSIIHNQDCIVEKAIQSISSVMPNFYKRSEWLDDETKP